VDFIYIIAICWHNLAQLRHCRAHSCILASLLNCAQFAAQLLQISAQRAQIVAMDDEPRNIKLAAVWQISVQSTINSM